MPLWKEENRSKKWEGSKASTKRGLKLKSFYKGGEQTVLKKRKQLKIASGNGVVSKQS